MPRLFTSTSQPGQARARRSQPAAEPRSPAKPFTPPEEADAAMSATALSTAAWVRPLTTTFAPDAASPLAMARPMPAVEPLTMAVLPERSMFMTSDAPGCGSSSNVCRVGAGQREYLDFHPGA